MKTSIKMPYRTIYYLKKTQITKERKYQPVQKTILKKKMPRLMISLFVFAAACSCGNNTELKQYTISTDRGNFTISMPQYPETATREITAPSGKIKIHMYFVNLEKKAYAVSYNDLPPGQDSSSEPQQVLASGRDGFIQAQGGKLLNDSVISYGEFPGREYEVEAGPYVYYARTFLVKKRLYQVMSAAGKDNEGRADAKRFLDSFSVNE